MGLDQYLYRTSKKNFDALESARKLCEECNDRFDKLYDEKYKKHYDAFPKDECGFIDKEQMNEEQKTNLSEIGKQVNEDMKRIANELNVELNEYNEPIIEGVTHGSEIAYWRKDWELHNYIIDNFCKDKENDNVVDIPLTKENVEQIIKWCPTGDDPLYMDYTEDTFKSALNMIEQGDVIYYHPWY